MGMVRRGTLAALGAAVAAVVVAALAPSAAVVELNGWYPCELAGGPREDAQCAVFRAPLCYAAADKRCGSSALRTRALDVFVKRLAPGGPTTTTPNVVIVQSGPGAQPLDIDTAMRSIARALGGAVDVYSLDRRGAGRSTKLDCVAAQAQTASSLGGVAISPEEVASCADELASKYARDLSVFSLTTAARDVQYFVENLLNGSGPTFVYGAGAHSAIIERLIHLDARANSSSIQGFILDGVATTSGAALDAFPYESKWDEAYDAVAQQFLALCASDADNCGRYFSGATATAGDALRAIEKNLEAPTSVCATALDGQLATVFDYKPGDYPPAQAFRWAMGELLRRATLRRLIPVVAYRFLRCNADDAKVLRHLFETLATTLRSSAEQNAARSSLLGQLVAFSEFWESPSPSKVVMDARFQATTITTGTYSLQAYCTFTKDNSTACAPFAEYAGYAASPLVYEKDAFWNLAARPRGNVSVLLLSGTLDPVTPHRQAQSLFTALNTTNKKLVAFEHATHGALWNTASTNGATCGIAVLASFVCNGGDLARLDSSCVANAPAQLSFALEPRVVANWLNASAAYDGAFQSAAGNNATTSGLKSALASPYKLAIIALCVLLGLALVLACVAVAKWRRAKKKSRGSTFCVDDPAYDEYCG